MSGSEYLEKIYGIFPWVEDPFTVEGLKRYQDTVSEFKTIVEHRWFKEFLDGREGVRIVDLCSGTGIGGIALAKTLLNLGIRADLSLLDLRRKALSKGEEFCSRELGFKPETLERDILEDIGLRTTFDIALMWGYTTPHFNPWNWVKALANVSQLLKDDGLFIYDELDRTYTVFYLVGYKDVLPEMAERDRVVLTIHKDKEFRSGYFTRLVLNPITGEREEMKVYFWDLASSATYTWLFFKDIDYMPIRRPYSGVVIAKSPRRKLELESIIREEKASMIK